MAIDLPPRKRQFFNLRNKEQAEIAVQAILEVLDGQEYIWASTFDDTCEMDIHLNHHLEPNNKKDKVSLLEHDSGTISLFIWDSYGVHTVDSEELDYIYASYGFGQIIIRFTHRHTGAKGQKVFRVTGKYDPS